MGPPWAASPWRCLSQMKQSSTPLPGRRMEAQLASGRRRAAGSRHRGPYTPNRDAVEAAAGLDGGAAGSRDVVLLRLLALVRVLEEAAHPHLRDAAGFLRWWPGPASSWPSGRSGSRARRKLAWSLCSTIPPSTSATGRGCPPSFRGSGGGQAGPGAPARRLADAQLGSDRGVGTEEALNAEPQQTPAMDRAYVP